MNITLMSKDLDTKKAEASALLTAQMSAAEKETRERTADEIAAVDAKLDECRALKARIDKAQGDANQLAAIAQLGGAPGPLGDEPTRIARVERRSWGMQFTESSEYRALIKAAGHRRSGAWISGPVELHATTLDGTTGSGGPLLIPQQVPGIVPLLFRPLTVSDLIPDGTTDSNAVLYLKEKTFTNAAAAVDEGAAKPESTLIFEQATAPVQKIAHWLPVTEEMMEDVPALASYIDARLRLGVDLATEDELLNGSGTPPHLMGLMNVVGKSPDAVRGADSNADAIFKQITQIATTAFVQPDGIVMNPINWQTIQLTKNANGNYLGMGPWNPPQTPTLWGLPVAVTPAQIAATALVGAFQMATQEFKKGGTRVEVSNSHSDFFVKNLLAIRAEQRLALAIYRPAGLGKVTGLA